MKIQQFEYEPLSHYSYVLLSGGEMAIIDPDRDPMHYYNFAHKENAKIKVVLLTHSHADFVSSHWQISKETGATIYNSSRLEAEYPFESFDGNSAIFVGNTKLEAINTPGHSYDSISILATDENEVALFTGDTLLIGDVGRPDLRGNENDKEQKKQALAREMFNTIRTKFKKIPNEAIIYPAHGAGSLCGKSMSADSSSTLGRERKDNWAFGHQNEDEFVKELLEDQPFIPAYFKHDVAMNKKKVESIDMATAKIPIHLNAETPKENILIVDSRDENEFKQGHWPQSINIMQGGEASSFETWLGTIIQPNDEFHLVVDSPKSVKTIARRVAKIGFENQLKAIITLSKKSFVENERLDFKHFVQNLDNYTIVDVRNTDEVRKKKIFDGALNQPLHELRDSIQDIPNDKPIIVHCGSGYRSAIGSSILSNELQDVKVYDLGEVIEKFK